MSDLNLPNKQKALGAFYTPESVVRTLLGWLIRDEQDRFLDPSCGDGNFISHHRNSVGIEPDPIAAHTAIQRAPWALVHEGDFFSWASSTVERFNAVGGNPPFIRYQTFSGDVRARAIALCDALGAHFSGLASSWAPFLVASASLLKPGGRMGFVVPAEIGHAPYAAPVIEYVAAHFSDVHVVAYRNKIFPSLSEDCWLLYANGFGGSTSTIRFSALDEFRPNATPPSAHVAVDLTDWKHNWNRRLRPYLLPQAARELYHSVLKKPDTKRIRNLARVGIGYVSGDNDFFHFRPSDADRWNIPTELLKATVRRSEYLPSHNLTTANVKEWKRKNEQVLLLRIPKDAVVPGSVARYLDSEGGKKARASYKCRNRSPWYSVPDVQVPDYFLTYMSGRTPSLVKNDADCTCTNSVHAVRFNDSSATSTLMDAWESDFVRLSCEIEGHPLGGGMLKLEPSEAGNIVVPSAHTLSTIHSKMARDAVITMRQWRHYVAEKE